MQDQESKEMLNEPQTLKEKENPGKQENDFTHPKEDPAVKEILLSLSKDIAAVRNKKDILTLIHPKLKLLFGTDDIFICFLDEKNELLDPVLRVGGENRTKHPDYYRIVNSSFPIHDGFIDKILNAKLPVTVDITRFPNPPAYMELSIATGLVETLSFSLYNAGKIVGIITLWAESGNFFNEQHQKLIAEIADYISIVVVNISAMDALNKKDRQNEILLSISNEIARIRGKEDLLHLIRHTIKAHIHFDDSFILRYYRQTKTAKAYIAHVEEARSADTAFKDHFSFEYPIDDDSIEDPALPVVHNVEAMLAAGMDEVSFIGNTGIKEFVSIKLVEGNQLIGFLILLSERKNSLRQEDLELLKRISFQISIATANIIANEDITSREEEKAILLGLSNDIASIRNRKDLFAVVDTKIKGLFSVKYFGIAQINADRVTYSSFISDHTELTKKLPGYKKLLADQHFVSDRVFSRIMNSDEPVLFNVDELALQPEIPAVVEFWKSAGLKWVLGAGLRVGGAPIGCAFLHLHTNETAHIKSTLLKGVCAQLAMKIANLLAYENIAKREEEKAILLDLSNKIAGLKNRNDFFEVVIAQLKKIFTFDGFAITYIHEDRETYGVFNVDSKYDLENNPDYKNVMSKRLSVTDPVYSMIINSPGAILLRINELARDNSMLTLVEFCRSKGIQQVLSVPLRVGGKVIGAASFHFLEIPAIDVESSLLKGVCAQLAVAISNILAAEEIEKREEEKSILLSISDEIASIRTRKDLFAIVNERFKTLFGIKEYGIAHVHPNGATYGAFMLDYEDVTTSHEDFIAITSAHYPVTDRLFRSVMDSNDPVLIDVNEWLQQPGTPAYVGWWKDLGIRHVLGIALRAGGRNIALIYIFIDNNEPFILKNNLLKGVCAQLAMKVVNVLANEEIAQRESEKSILLSLSHEIASLDNREDLFRVVNNSIKDLFSVKQFGITTIDEDGLTHSVFMIDLGPSISNPDECFKLSGLKYKITDKAITEVMASDEPVILDIDELVEESGASVYTEYWEFKQFLCLSFKVGTKGIGCIFFNVDANTLDRSKNNLLKGVCAQLAVAVSNILADEEIAKREEEKTILLSLSNDIASLKNRSDLFQVVNNRIKEIFSISQFGIVKINEDRTTHSAFMMDLGEAVMGQIDFEEIIKLKFDINDQAFSSVMASDEPIILNISELAGEPDPPEYVKFWQYAGFEQLLCLALRAAGNDIGCVFFNMDANALNNLKVNLLKGICDQLSVAVANILANEKVLDQLAEINNYKQQLEEEKTYLIEEIETSQNHAEIIGDGANIKKVFQLVKQVAYTDSTVLLLGETGTGKELIARAIHNSSPRKSNLMIKINCAALPPHLIESELFGHERGSFTGAFERRIGKFELANKGTLFLDEIGEMSLDLQAKLLRALQEKEIERIGGKTTIHIDARIIAATNRDLIKLMNEGKFRSDLYYRLNIFPITLPALRNRREDIAGLTSFFIARYSKKAGKKINTISNKALQELIDYDWPGNIRELEHLIERSILLTTGETVREVHLPNQPKHSNGSYELKNMTIKTIDENEKDYILSILKQVKGRIGGDGGAAELLGVPTSTLHSKMRRLGIRKEHLG